MTIPLDPITAVQAYLREDADLVAELGAPALVTTRELTRGAADSMPRKQVLISAAGGARDDGRVELTRVRVDVRCYAETLADAARVDRAVLHALKDLDRREVPGEALLHDAVVETGPIPLRESEINDTPVVLRSYLVLASEASQ